MSNRKMDPMDSQMAEATEVLPTSRRGDPAGLVLTVDPLVRDARGVEATHLGGPAPDKVNRYEDRRACATSSRSPSGIIGNVMTYEQNGKQYVAVLSGVGGWAGIGLAAGLTEPTAGLGAVGGYAALSNFTALGGQLTVFSLP
jgi:hypothetical protein